MQRLELTITINRKVNLGNYESMDLFVSEKVSLESADMGPEAVADTVLAELKEILRKGFETIPQPQR